MIGLILDTSTDSCLIALSKNQQLIASTVIAHEQNLSKTLLPAIEQLLLESKISLKDLFKISVGVGPGSYTGTRIAVAVAESLSLALSVPLYSFCSLLAFLPPNLPQGAFAFLTNLKYPTWFLLKGYFEDGIIHPTYSVHTLPKEQVPPFLKEVPSLLTFSGPNLLDQLPENVIQGAMQFEAQPNFSLLLSHLSGLELHPPKKPEIVYLHSF